MTTYATLYTSPGTDLQRERDRQAGPNLTITPGKQYCEHGQHYVKRPGYVTRKGWMCDECKEEMNHAQD